MDLTSWLVDGLTVSDLLKFSTEWRDMGQSYRFCAGVRNDRDPTHSAIVPSSRPRARRSQFFKMS
jgi:hypothetical protein